MVDAETILSVRHLVTHSGPADQGHAVCDVSFDLKRHGVLGIVGESGSGKTLTALSIMRLLPPTAWVEGGEVVFEGRNLLELSQRDMQRLRGRRIAMTFQEPATALSPVHTVGWQLGTALQSSGRLPPIPLWVRRARAMRAPAVELLRRVELPDPERVLDAYPHQLSAGMRRRIALALALAGSPTLLIADEPTMGLDTPIQAQILDLFTRLTREEQLMTSIFISHDLSVVAEVATEVAVMYAGQIVEAGPVQSVFARPQHPYTASLLDNVPGSLRSQRVHRPAPASAPSRGADAGARDVGCRFRARCSLHQQAPHNFPRCVNDTPMLEPPLARHRARCFYPRLDDPETA